MSSNLSILQRNIIDALDCEVASQAFLRACDRTGVLEAERFAIEVRQLVQFLDPALAKAATIHELEAVPDGLLQYMLDRHWHSWFPRELEG